MNELKVYEKLIDLKLFTKEELELLININGFNLGTLNDALYVRYGDTLDDLEKFYELD